MSFRVFCMHRWSPWVEPILDRGAENIRVRVCGWCESVWREGEAVPRVEVGFIERV